MYSTTLITVLASAATLASALPSAADFSFFMGGSHHHRKAARTQYNAAREYKQDADMLEPYATYHERYMTFECQNKHNTDFWNTCCHPVLNWQDPATALPDQCWDAVSDDGGDCDAGDDGGSSTYSSDSPSSTTQAPGNPGGDPPASKTSSSHKSTHTSSDSGSSDSGSSDSGSGDSSSITWNGPGYGTWFKQGGNAGACGDKHSDDDLIIAIDQRRWNSDMNFGVKSDLCGKQVTIRKIGSTKEVTATIADVCPTCETAPGGEEKNSIDMSLGTFQKLADLNDGQILIEWHFV